MIKNSLPKLDEQWFTRLCAISNYTDEAEWLQQYSHISASEKELFSDNETENPQFSLKKTIPTDKVADQIDSLLSDLAKEEKNAVVLDLYRHKLDRHTVRDQLVQASLGRNDKEFYRHSADLYGKPKKKYFIYVAKRVIALAESRKVSHPVMAKRLKKIFSKIDVQKVDISADILPPLVTEGTPITSAEQAAVIFEAVLTRLEITDWKVVVDTKAVRNRFAVNPYRKIVHIPSTKYLMERGGTLTSVHIEALAEHEVGVHVRRGYEGACSQLLLLQIGLDSYLAGEEGLASYSQQQIEGATEFYGFDRYLAASLAIGMDGVKRDFRTVFAIMTDYYTLWYDTASAERVQKAAWDVCVRIFRGTTGQTPGTIYTKDIVYLEGNIEMWHLIADKPDIFESLFVGKYNPLLARHVKSLQTLEVLL